MSELSDRHTVAIEGQAMEGKRAYSLYDAIRRVLDPLRRDWDSFTQEERELILRELEGFIQSVKPPET
jgi:hypothetical protein